MERGGGGGGGGGGAGTGNRREAGGEGWSRVDTSLSHKLDERPTVLDGRLFSCHSNLFVSAPQSTLNNDDNNTKKAGEKQRVDAGQHFFIEE